MTQTVTIRAGEKIPVPGTYGNVTIEAELSKNFPDDADSPAALREVADMVELFVAEERELILAQIRAGTASG